MGGYNYARFISDFGERTIDNQNKIDRLRRQDQLKGVSEEEIDKKHHEVTQLINSLLGLLIVPYEKYKFSSNNPHSAKEQDLKRTRQYKTIAKMIIDLEKRGKLYNDYNEWHLVSSFIKHLRNSLAHSGSHGLQFFPIASNSAIDSIIFYDEDEGKKFCAELSISDVRKLSGLLAEMYKSLEHILSTDGIGYYKHIYNKHKELMNDPNKPKWAVSFENRL